MADNKKVDLRAILERKADVKAPQQTTFAPGRAAPNTSIANYSLQKEQQSATKRLAKAMKVGEAYIAEKEAENYTETMLDLQSAKSQEEIDKISNDTNYSRKAVFDFNVSTKFNTFTAGELASMDSNASLSPMEYRNKLSEGFKDFVGTTDDPDSKQRLSQMFVKSSDRLITSHAAVHAKHMRISGINSARDNILAGMSADGDTISDTAFDALDNASKVLTEVDYKIAVTDAVNLSLRQGSTALYDALEERGELKNIASSTLNTLTALHTNVLEAKRKEAEKAQKDQQNYQDIQNGITYNMTSKEKQETITNVFNATKESVNNDDAIPVKEKDQATMQRFFQFTSNRGLVSEQYKNQFTKTMSVLADKEGKVSDESQRNFLNLMQLYDIDSSFAMKHLDSDAKRNFELVKDFYEAEGDVVSAFVKAENAIKGITPRDTKTVADIVRHNDEEIKASFTSAVSDLSSFFSFNDHDVSSDKVGDLESRYKSVMRTRLLAGDSISLANKLSKRHLEATTNVLYGNAFYNGGSDLRGATMDAQGNISGGVLLVPEKDKLSTFFDDYLRDNDRKFFDKLHPALKVDDLDENARVIYDIGTNTFTLSVERTEGIPFINRDEKIYRKVISADELNEYYLDSFIANEAKTSIEDVRFKGG